MKQHTTLVPLSNKPRQQKRDGGYIEHAINPYITMNEYTTQHQTYTMNATRTDLYHNLSSSHFFVTGTLPGLSEFDSADTATICYMHQLKLLILFAS